MQKAKPCPFCGKEIDLSDSDTIYPSGSAWIETNEIRHYVHFLQALKEQWCYGIHCVVSSGGCGASITADSKQEVIEKWNSRNKTI